MPLGMKVGLGPGDIVLDGDPPAPTERGTATPHFSAHFALARSPISAAAELLYWYLILPELELVTDSLIEQHQCLSDKHGRFQFHACVKAYVFAQNRLFANNSGKP